MTSVIERLKNNARGKRAVTDDGNAMVVGTANQFIADFEAQRRRHGAAGMAGHEQIENTFLGIGITHEAATGADGVEAAKTAGHELMRIDLMAGVPNQAILREVKS